MNTYLVSYVEQITDVEVEARIQATSYSEMIKILESNGGQILVTGCNMVPSLAVKKEDTTNKKIMNIVNAICNAQATDCKSYNKVELARQLLNIANVPSNASIQEIPLDWNQQVVVMFSVPNDNNYYSLFAGIGKDTGLFHFELAIDGETKNGEFVWHEVTMELHIDYFKNGQGQSTNGQKEGNHMTLKEQIEVQMEINRMRLIDLRETLMGIEQALDIYNATYIGNADWLRYNTELKSLVTCQRQLRGLLTSTI